MRSAPAPHVAGLSDDAELVRRALTRDDTAFRTIMERYNRRLYRIARGILRNDSEAEDVVQVRRLPCCRDGISSYLC
jgi:RNA polymerase sigma-70 factor, ECF subfamily